MKIPLAERSCYFSLLPLLNEIALISFLERTDIVKIILKNI